MPSLFTSFLSSLFLLAFSMLLDKFILPGNMNAEIENDQNWGLALVSGSVTISVAATLDTMLLDVPCPGTDAYDLMMRSLPSGSVDTSRVGLLQMYPRGKTSVDGLHADTF